MDGTEDLRAIPPRVEAARSSRAGNTERNLNQGTRRGDHAVGPLEYPAEEIADLYRRSSR